jgi:dTDP-4-amino-4,6-dideoxygalactose transaminase
MITTPFLDLAAAHRQLADEIEPAVLAVLRSGRYILGPEVEAFEAAFAARVGARHCIGVGNGSDALRLSLEGLGIGPGDEVIVPAHTYISTWFSVSAVGARPVPVEVDERTYVLDPDLVEGAIGPRTRAIVPVHLYGHPAPMTELLEIARRHGLRVVEDAAQAHGATLGGREVGTFGDAAAWSFYPVKNLGAAGDAGAITTHDDALARRLRMARNQGSLERSAHEIVGSCSRLDPLQAVILGVKLRRLDEWNASRRAIAAHYLHGLADSSLRLPMVARGVDPVWHQFVVRHPDRDSLRDALARAGIETLVHYETAPHRQEAYASLRLGPGSLPLAEQLSGEILSLPIDPLLPVAAVDRVIATIQAWDRAGAAAQAGDHARVPVPGAGRR